MGERNLTKCEFIIFVPDDLLDVINPVCGK